MQIMAVAFAASALAFGAIAFAAALAAAVADSSRPDSDTTRDANRKPEQTLAFSGIKPGDRVADYVADAGYFTRLFASVVGSTGHVYAVEPTAFFKFDSESSILANPADPRTAKVFDQTIRGHTDQFILKFRKPE